MSHHTITEDELSEWLRKPQWHSFAMSIGGGSNKSLDIDVRGAPQPIFRVTSHGETIFLGADRSAAVRRYNEER